MQVNLQQTSLAAHVAQLGLHVEGLPDAGEPPTNKLRVGRIMYTIMRQSSPDHAELARTKPEGRYAAHHFLRQMSVALRILPPL
jgi:hypothetical protein